MKVIIAGDFAPRARLAKQIEDKLFSEMFPDDIQAIIKSADFSFVNFESPIAEPSYKPIPKCGPNLCCTNKAAEAVKYAGFTGVTMANNHILDFGIDGLDKSVECCKSNGLDVVGVGHDIHAAAEILYLEKDGKTLAVINCCEHEFSIATNNSAGANPLNPVQQFYSIQEVRKTADYVLLVVHGGHEHFQLPSPRMQETYRFFVDAGADAVVNHHQHCYSGYEVYKGKPIFYGLGNFCFDIEPVKNNSPWNYGYMAELTFGETIEFTLHPYHQYGEKAAVEKLDATSFDTQLNELNAIIANPDLLQTKIDDYYNESVDFETFVLEPYYGRIMAKLFDLGIVPSLMKDKKKLFVLNHILCESHRDKMVFALRHSNTK